MTDRLRFVGFSVLVLLIASVGPAFANKSEVALNVPDTVRKGEEITIKVTVTHSSNNFMHYTDWVYVAVNGKEIKRWAYSWRSRPESNVFELEVKHLVDGPLEITAQSDCNIHGSKGIVKASPKVSE